MNYQRILLDTWLRTFAIFPKEKAHWFKELEKLKSSKSVTFILEPEETSTSFLQILILEK